MITKDNLNATHINTLRHNLTQYKDLCPYEQELISAIKNKKPSLISCLNTDNTFVECCGVYVFDGSVYRLSENITIEELKQLIFPIVNRYNDYDVYTDDAGLPYINYGNPKEVYYCSKLTIDPLFVGFIYDSVLTRNMEFLVGFTRQASLHAKLPSRLAIPTKVRMQDTQWEKGEE